ncbi:MAG: hypothetical protein JSU87_16815 [Gemmatimonadota bacterium]|nr:MAG: hypothetical protein JSU87_16815 [Gemmatimonadota bacterium]
MALLLRMSAIALLMLAASSATDAAAQEVVFQSRGRGMPAADQRLKEVLERGNYRVIARDSLIPEGETVARDLIVIRASLRLEGRIEGDLIGVQSDIFARPGATIVGSVVVLAGGFYGSALADLTSPPIDASHFEYRAELREDGVFVISAPRTSAGLRLPGLYGVQQPTYERVNALTLPWAVAFDRGISNWLPDARGTLRYRTGRGKLDGDLRLVWSAARHQLDLRAGKTVRTNDDWANDDLANSLYSFVGAIDTRNYYEAKFVEGAIGLEYGTKVRWKPGVKAAWEDGRSLGNEDPFSLFSVLGGFQPNLPVSEIEIVSLTVETEADAWLNDRTTLGLKLGAEFADQDIAGDTSFTLVTGSLDVEVGLAARHSLLLEGRGRASLANSGAPPQRWRALGGWGSLPTLGAVERAGDQFWWLATTYRVRLSERSSRLNRVVAWLQYAAGNAWPKGSARPSTTHNLALGASFGPLSAGLYTAPGDDFKTVLFVGIDMRFTP